MAYNGSIDKIEEIPQYIRKLYRTVWEIPQKHFINLAAGRAPFICQSQSLNIYMSDIAMDKISNMHFYGWKKGLKTGLYYLRSRPAADAIKFTVDMEKVNAENKKPVLGPVADNKENLGKRSSPGKLTNEEGLAYQNKAKKLKTVAADDYEEEQCLNCGS